MKAFFLSITMLAMSTFSFAQSEKFQATMLKNITMLDSAKSMQEITEVADNFERIANAEKTQWLPYYYAALAQLRTGFMVDNAKKDAVADKADGLISSALSLEPKSSEMYVLKNMAATVHMLVDPMNRWQKYGGDAREALAMAKQLDPNNPRPYFMEGQTVMNTPEQFGGGKDKALPIFEKAVALYKTFTPVSKLYPVWGAQESQKMLLACQAK